MAWFIMVIAKNINAFSSEDFWMLYRIIDLIESCESGVERDEFYEERWKD